MDILEVARRYFNQESIRSISRQTGFDRKTIQKYIGEIEKRDISQYDKKSIVTVVTEATTPMTGRPNKSSEILTNYISEIKKHIEAGLKLKTIYEVLIEQHELKISYSSFKRFTRKNKLRIIKNGTTCRLEKHPGEELQVDYAKMGMLYDPLHKKRKTVYAFIGTLSFSRHKYVEFVYSQDQQSFVQSHVKMFNYFGRAPKIVIIDNLKSGVIKPDLYDPKLNRAYNEMAEYYECFINPARVATPKDKPIVERDVQTVREQFKKFKAINENLSITEANKQITDWAINKYGQREHGTTREKPYEQFVSIEKEKMLPLPAAPFEAAIWKEASVHPDHYIQVGKKAYSVPHQYVGKRVWVKQTSKLVYVYYEEKLIKQHTIPNGYRQTDFNDFPDNMKHVLQNGMPGYLVRQAKSLSNELGKLVEKILTPHAYMNMRKAQGIIRIAETLDPELISAASTIAINNYKRITPKSFFGIIEQINTKEQKEEKLFISDETSSFIRETDYFIYHN